MVLPSSAVQFAQPFLDEVRSALGALGVTSCPACRSESVLIDSRPTIISVGGFHHPEPDPRHDPEANVVFAVAMRCEVCGHLAYFDAEKFRSGDEPTLMRP